MIPVRAESRTLAGPAPLNLKRDPKHSRTPRLAQADRKDLLDAIDELAAGVTAKALLSPLHEREALEAVARALLRKGRSLRAAGRRVGAA